MSEQSFLDGKFVDKRPFVSYASPPLSQDVADVEEWQQRAQFLQTDLEWLLKLVAKSFWNEVCFNPSISNCLRSYLQYAPRTHEYQWGLLTDDLVDQQHKLHRVFFLVFLRLSTSKEADLSTEMFVACLSRCQIIDLVALVDICVLFGNENRLIIQKMVASLFQSYPFMREQFASFGANLHQTIRRLQQRMKQNIDISDLKDVASYLRDVGLSLQSLFQSSPPAAVRSMSNVDIALVHFYEELYNELSRRAKPIRKRWTTALSTLVAAVDAFWEKSFLEEGMEQELVNAMSEVLDCNHFVAELGRRGWLEKLKKAKIDDANMEFIQDSFAAAMGPEEASTQGATALLGAEGGATAADPSLLQLREMFPDLQERILCNALSQGRSIDVAITQLLEFQSKNQAMAAGDEEFPLLAQRRNIFEGDEFDVFSRSDIDMSKIHQGKREKPMLPLERGISLQADEAYEDEYDDTYDDHGPGADDADSEEETLLGRKVVVPRVLAQQRGLTQEDDNMESGSDDGEADEKDEENAQQQQKQPGVGPPERGRGRGRGTGRGTSYQNPAGESSQRDRRMKEANKSRVANHRRKNLAAKKFNSGMF